MHLSYWEIKSWLTNIYFTIVGSGIVSLSCALQLKERFPKANILVLEKGVLPQGASTKNACFGSLSEILDDLQFYSEEDLKPLFFQKRHLKLTSVRLGGMGVAIGSLIGKELVGLYSNNGK